MAQTVDPTQAIADLNFWLKTQTGDPYLLSDIPEIISLRWPYFRDNWESLKPEIEAGVEDYSNPDFLAQQIIDFSTFINQERTSPRGTNPFADSSIFNRFYAIFDSIEVQSINLTKEEASISQSKITASNLYSRADFQRIKDTIRKARDQRADQFGLTDVDYNAIYGIVPLSEVSSASIVDVNQLLVLQNSLTVTDFILSNQFSVQSQVDRFAAARAIANNPEIDIGSYSSGKLVKLFYGESLESLATRYLGDPSKWIDIAIANGLQPPYIDEVGEALPLIANASGSFINIAKLDGSGVANLTKLYPGQLVILTSNLLPAPVQRSIVSITEIPVSGELIVELDGDTSLDAYTVATGAKIRIFKPDTINSNFYILIPTKDPLAEVRQDVVPWFLRKSAADEKNAKVDLFIDDNNDLVFTPNGDLSLSYGLENAVQALKLKMIIELGSLRYHPNFGLVSVLGNKNNDIASVKNLIVSSLTTQIAADSRFDRIQNLDIRYVNPGGSSPASVVSIDMAVRLAGSSTVVPITFSIPLSPQN